MPDDIRAVTDPWSCPGADACAWPGICLPGRCIAAEAADSPHALVFAHPASLAPHCPPGLALLRGLPDEWTEPPDRQPAAPRHLPRGAPFLGTLAWALACWAALGGAAWALHWLICN